jgi:nucleoside 2-deoxyribosyltransferase
MWFNDEVFDAYKIGIYQAIRNDCGYHAVRIDTEEYNGDVIDRVLAEINESRFVVADLTNHRNGVYFEAGYAMGLEIPVIWTCRADQGAGTHFDAEHFNQIRWTTPVELRDKLQARIRATIGRGPLAPEVVVAASAKPI